MSEDLPHLARLAGIDPRPGEAEELRRRLEVLQQLIDALPDEVVEAADPVVPDLLLRNDEPGPALAPFVLDRLGDGLVDLPPVREEGP